MKKGETALHFAAKEGKKEIISFLISSKDDSDIDARDAVRTGITCLTNVLLLLIRITFLEKIAMLYFSLKHFVFKRGNSFVRVVEDPFTYKNIMYKSCTQMHYARA